jgi:hypothetical protein
MVEEYILVVWLISVVHFSGEGPDEGGARVEDCAQLLGWAANAYHSHVVPVEVVLQENISELVTCTLCLLKHYIKY